ncbi:ArsR/SmtB family transcription factor [Pyrodictium abyssi]|uniref:HTH arsR-type domain-containing protein n=1 Tax=Pyrodictium abyssi TaxID=54256 RepID=A0ABM8IXE5_9CREN|nr:hypothetical protein PABY_17800 [Pyrodictium abyssi]
MLPFSSYHYARWRRLCRELEELARVLDALSHPLRLRIVALLWSRGELYLAEIASALGVSRALAKIHLKKLESAGLVESRVAVEEHRAVARRFYRLKWRGEICVSPEQVARMLKSCGGGGVDGAEGDGKGDDMED